MSGVRPVTCDLCLLPGPCRFMEVKPQCPECGQSPVTSVCPQGRVGSWRSSRSVRSAASHHPSLAEDTDSEIGQLKIDDDSDMPPPGALARGANSLFRIRSVSITSWCPFCSDAMRYRYAIGSCFYV